MADRLQNTYWLLRHGRSKANESKIIVSDLANGQLDIYGLTPAGEEQAIAAGQKLLEELKAVQIATMHVYHSPFSRAYETAVLASEPLGLTPESNQFHVEPDLRERFFGDYELQSDKHYSAVWARDEVDPEEEPPGDGESVEDVASRIRSLFRRLERTHDGATILLVSHGDTLSILWAVMNELPLTMHRQFGLETGELRCLNDLS